MSKLILLLVSLSMLGGRLYLERTTPPSEAVVDEAPQSPSKLRLLTWNVGYADVERDSRARLGDMRAVAKVIRRSRAEVVALQELTGREQLDALVAALGEPWTGHLAQGGKTDRYTAVLSKRDARFDEVRCGKRVAAVAELDLDGEPFVLASAHAPAYSARGRRLYVDQLVTWAGRQAGRTFIAGDFNLDVTPVADASTFTDDAKRDGESYSQLVEGRRDLGRLAGATADGGRRIDYLFGPRELKLRSARVLASVGVGRMDHRPLVVEVTW